MINRLWTKAGNEDRREPDSEEPGMYLTSKVTIITQERERRAQTNEVGIKRSS